MHIADIIKGILEQEQRSQAWISRATGIRPAKMSRFLSGIGTIHANELLLILLAFEMEIVDDRDRTVINAADFIDNKTPLPEGAPPPPAEPAGIPAPVADKPTDQDEPEEENKVEETAE